jgi:ribosomal protein bL25 (Ctc-form)
MENQIIINAELREEISKKACKSLRAQGKIPAIVYGITSESIPIAVELSAIKNIMKSEKKENTILQIMQSNKVKSDAMIKEIQYDYLSDHIIHVDFIRIDLKKLVEVEIPVALFGEAIGVKTEDGLLEFISRNVHVRCLPTQIPKEIRVDVSFLRPIRCFAPLPPRPRKKSLKWPKWLKLSKGRSKALLAPLPLPRAPLLRMPLPLKRTRARTKARKKIKAKANRQRRDKFLFSLAWATLIKNMKKHRTMPGSYASTRSAGAMISSWPGWETSCNTKKPSSAANRSSW